MRLQRAFPPPVIVRLLTAAEAISAGTSLTITQALSKQYCIYIITTPRNTVLRAGVANDLIIRPSEILTIGTGSLYNLQGSPEQREGLFGRLGQSQNDKGNCEQSRRITGCDSET